MLEEVQNVIKKASGAVAAPARNAGQMAREITRKTRLPVDEIADKGKEYARSLRATVSGEIKRQLEGMGVATKTDLEKLYQRIDTLEAKVAKLKPAASTGAPARRPRKPADGP